MATVTRSRIVQPGDTIKLKAVFRGPDGSPVDLDSFPQITILSPNGGVVLGPTSTGVFRASTGEFGFDFEMSLQPEIGVWRDFWQGTLNGFTVTGEFTFQVNTTQLPAINTDGYVHLGDDPGFNYSQEAIKNINNLLKTLRARLKSAGKRKTTDEFGNVVFEQCDIFSSEELVTFIANSLTAFNQTPTFTFFTFENTNIIENFHDVLVQGATLMALASQALIERGREFNISDNAISFTPPTISEQLSTQWSSELTNWYEKVKLIKHNMKPDPTGLGSLRAFNAQPALMRMRHLRGRRLF